MADFLGCPYPIVKNSRGLLATQSGVDQIRSDLFCLLMTNPGERVFLPTFGTALRTLMFEPNDPTITTTAKQMIINAINQWEPRVVINSIDITNNISTSELNPNDNKTELNSILGISIQFYDPENIKDIQQLVLEIPITGT